MDSNQVTSTNNPNYEADKRQTQKAWQMADAGRHMSDGRLLPPINAAPAESADVKPSGEPKLLSSPEGQTINDGFSEEEMIHPGPGEGSPGNRPSDILLQRLQEETAEQLRLRLDKSPEVYDLERVRGLVVEALKMRFPEEYVKWQAAAENSKRPQPPDYLRQGGSPQGEIRGPFVEEEWNWPEGYQDIISPEPRPTELLLERLRHESAGNLLFRLNNGDRYPVLHDAVVTALRTRFPKVWGKWDAEQRSRRPQPAPESVTPVSPYESDKSIDGETHEHIGPMMGADEVQYPLGSPSGSSPGNSA